MYVYMCDREERDSIFQKIFLYVDVIFFPLKSLFFMCIVGTLSWIEVM